MINLSEIRKQEGVSQKRLAEELNVSAGNLCDWEKGRSEPDIETLIRIADFFDVSLDAIVGREIKDHSDIPANALKTRLLTCYNKLSEEGKIKLVEFLETQVE